MKRTQVCITVVMLGVASIAVTALPTAHAADSPSSGGPGHQLQVIDGTVVQGWTVSALRPSADVIPYPVRGALWEADATDEALQGVVVPVIPNFNARSGTGQAYRVLFEVATPQGVNPSTLAQGQKVSGKLYFDVTGEAPDRVVYSAGGRDLLVWTAVQPDGVESPGTAPAPLRAPRLEPAVDRPAPPGEDTVPGADVAGAAVTAPPPVWQGTALPAESAPPARQGTPIPEAAPQPDADAPVWVGTPAAGEPARHGTPVTPALQPPVAGPPPPAS